MKDHAKIVGGDMREPQSWSDDMRIKEVIDKALSYLPSARNDSGSACGKKLRKKQGCANHGLKHVRHKEATFDFQDHRYRFWCAPLKLRNVS